jgi:NADH-quinone oxidoreductase subunit J
VTEFFTTIAFYTFGLLAIGGAIGMVMARRLVHSAIFVVGSFVGVAAIYLLARADFLAGVQVLIYAGAIMILMLFAIMLTPGQVDSRGASFLGQKVGALLVAGSFLAVVVFALLRTPWPLATKLSDAPTTQSLGTLMMSSYVLPFEMASVLLLAAMVGAILIARED